MAVDVSKLKTPKEAQNLMDNARRMGREDVYQAAFARKCELESDGQDDRNDPLVRDFWITVAAYEQLLSEKNERRTAASRTRQKVSKDGILATVQSWARKREPTMGFELLSRPDNGSLPASTSSSSTLIDSIQLTWSLLGSIERARFQARLNAGRDPRPRSRARDLRRLLAYAAFQRCLPPRLERARSVVDHRVLPSHRRR